MNAKEFNEIIDKIDVDKKTKEGILELIDVKSKSNMEPILNEIRAIQQKSDLEFRRIQEKSDSEFREIRSDFKSEFSEIRSEFKIINSELKRIEDKNDTKTNMLIGLIGILITILVASKFIH